MSTQEWDTRVSDNMVDALTTRVIELAGKVALLERRLAEQGEAERAWICAALRANLRAEQAEAARDAAIHDLHLDRALDGPGGVWDEGEGYA